MEKSTDNNFFNQISFFWQRISFYFTKKTVAIVAILILAMTIPLTVFIAQQRQEVRQQAGGCLDERATNPNLGESCFGCITREEERLVNDIRNLLLSNGHNLGSCSDLNLLNYWCNGGIGPEAAEQCRVWQDRCEPACSRAPTPTLRRDTTGPATSCNGSVASTGNEERYETWNGQCSGVLQKGGSGGIGQGCCELACGADSACDEQFAGSGNCDASCALKGPTPTPTRTPTPTPTPLPTNTPSPTKTPVPTPTKTPVPTPTPPIYRAADINRDGKIDLLDFNAWFTAFKNGQALPNTYPDVNNDGKIDLLDFNLWYRAIKGS